MQDNIKTTPTTLRKRAEAKIASDKTPFSVVVDSTRLVHELQVHQAELEMQNEELVRSHAELAASKKHYSDLYDLAPIGYLTLTAQGLIHKANITVATMLGCDRTELIGTSFSRFIHPEDQNHHYTARNKFSETGETDGWEVRLLRTDTTVLWVHLQSSRAAHGEEWLTISNISALKLMEAERTKSEALYRSLVEASEVLIWQCDGEGRFTFLNPAWQRVYGYDIAEMRGKKFSNFQAADAATRDDEVHIRLMAGTPITGYETTHRGIDGNKIHLIVNARPITAQNGTVIGTSGTAYDITEQRQKLEVEAEISSKNDRLLSLFVQNCSAVLKPSAGSGSTMNINLDQLSTAIQNDESVLRNKKLTKREREVLILVGQGFSSKNITEQLGIREKTVEMHRTNLMRKLGTVNAATLGRWASIAAQITITHEHSSMAS